MRKTRNLYSNFNKSKTTSLYNKIFQKENESNYIKIKNKRNINKNIKDLSQNKNINMCNKNIIITRNKNENNIFQNNHHSIILNNRKEKKRNIENLNLFMNKTLLNNEKRILINEITTEIEPSTLSNTCLKSEIELSIENNKSKESLNLSKTQKAMEYSIKVKKFNCNTKNNKSLSKNKNYEHKRNKSNISNISTNNKINLNEKLRKKLTNKINERNINKSIGIKSRNIKKISISYKSNSIDKKMKVISITNNINSILNSTINNKGKNIYFEKIVNLKNNNLTSRIGDKNNICHFLINKSHIINNNNNINQNKNIITIKNKKKSTFNKL